MRSPPDGAGFYAVNHVRRAVPGEKEVVMKKKFLTIALAAVMSLSLAVPFVPARAATYDDITEGTYVLVNQESGRVLDVRGNANSSKEQSLVHVYDRQNPANKSQQFSIKKTAGGWYNMSPLSNTKTNVNPYADAPKNKTNINIWEALPNDNTQGWYFEAAGDCYIIRNAYNTNLVLAESGSANLSQVKVMTYKSGSKSQLWKLTNPDGSAVTQDPPAAVATPAPTPTPAADAIVDAAQNAFQNFQDAVDAAVPTPTPAPSGSLIDSSNQAAAIPTFTSGGAYVLVNAESGRILDIYGNVDSSKNKANAQVYKWKSGTNKSQQFKITNTTGSWYTIVPLSNTGLCLNVDGAAKNGSNVNVLTASKGSKNQSWIFERTADGRYIIRSAANTDLVLTEAGTKNMSNVKLAAYKAGSASQLWSVSGSASMKAAQPLISKSEMQTIIKKIGVQDGTKGWKSICASVCLSYAYYWDTGKVAPPNKAPISKDGSAQWANIASGNSRAYKSNSALFAGMKAELDEGDVCIVHVYSSAGEHWMLVYGYTGSGNKAGDFLVADPWDGSLDNLASCGYKIHSDHRLAYFEF